jgi:hypothetical protein
MNPSAYARVHLAVAPRSAPKRPEEAEALAATSFPCSEPTLPCSVRFLSLLRGNREKPIHPSVPEQKNLQQNTPKRPKKTIFPVIFPVIAD